MTRRHGWLLGGWLLVAVPPLAAQAWDAPDAVALRRLGEARRTRESASTALGWHGRAEGTIGWFVQTGPEAGRSTPRTVSTDVVELEVYGRGGGRSKQILRAWRRGRALPADITYHRDHLGIVTDGFGDQIRLGDGDEVRDVLHPLAPGADSLYAVALGDSLTVSSPDGQLQIRQLLVRPRRPASPAVIGALGLETATGALVRFVFGFSPAAYRDDTVEDITVTLDQARAGTDVWLPYRQSLEIRRRAARADLPIRTLIRADWRIAAELDSTITDSALAGERIVGPRRPTATPLPPAPTLTGDAGVLARGEVERLVGLRLRDARAGARARTAGASSVAAFDRVQGLSLGGGITLGIGAGVRADLDLGLGVSTAEPTGQLHLHGPLGDGRWSARIRRRVQDVADQPVISGALNSLRTLVAADDAGDYALVSAAELGWGRPFRAGRPALGLTLGVEGAADLRATARTLWNQVRPNPALGTPTFAVIRAQLEGRAAGLQLEGGLADTAKYARVTAWTRTATPLAGGTLGIEARAGLASRGTPARRGFVLGGRGTLVGERYRAYDGYGMALVRVDWMTLVRVPTLRLRGPVTTGSRIRFGPFVAAGAAWRDVTELPGRGNGGVRPVVGVAAEPFWGLLRLEAGLLLRGPDAGRLRLTLDAHPDWWPIL